jgi:hypothetical protein
MTTPPAISSTSTTVIRVELGHVVNREWIWDKDEEIVITSPPITRQQCLAIAHAVFGCNRVGNMEIEKV